MSTPRLAPIPPYPLLSVVMSVNNERTTVESIIRGVVTAPTRIVNAAKSRGEVVSKGFDHPSGIGSSSNRELL